MANHRERPASWDTALRISCRFCSAEGCACRAGDHTQIVRFCAAQLLSRDAPVPPHLILGTSGKWLFAHHRVGGF